MKRNQPQNNQVKASEQVSEIEPASLRLKNISKKFDKHQILSGINFQLDNNEIICLLGASGCGKTTTLMLIAGIEKPDEGEVWIKGKKVSGGEKFVPPEKRNTGFVFQDYALFPHLTVERNVSFGIKGLRRTERKQRVWEELKRLGMESYTGAYPHQLSGGERQRIALARALAADPVILLLDEPFSGLDRHLREHLREESVAVLRERGVGCVFVTHDPEEACYVADRIVLIDEGRVLQQGKAKELYDNPNSLEVARLFGKVNHFKAQIIQGAARLGALAVPTNVASEGVGVEVVFRPEAISFTKTENSIALDVKLEESYFLGKNWELKLQMPNNGQKLTAIVPASQLTENSHSFYLDLNSVHIFSV